MEKIKYILNLLLVGLIFATIAINRDGRVLKTSVDKLVQQQEEVVQLPAVIEEGGFMVYQTKAFVTDIVGYSGRVPVKMYVKDGVIAKITLEENSETESFLNQALSTGLLDAWNGKTIKEAQTLKVDAVSGATMSSAAIIGNIERAIAYAADAKGPAATGFSWDWLNEKVILGLLVILFGLFVIFVRPKNEMVQLIYELCNVLVVGFWCGSFLSLSQFTSMMANGFNPVVAFIPMVLLLVMIVLPFLGKKGTYCAVQCPMGSAQRLMGKTRKTKYKIPHMYTQYLSKLRETILIILLVMAWLGFSAELFNYEVFSAFLFRSASIPVLIMAALVILLSPFIDKPYCRFICPTGALITYAQKTKND